MPTTATVAVALSRERFISIWDSCKEKEGMVVGIVLTVSSRVGLSCIRWADGLGRHGMQSRKDGAQGLKAYCLLLYSEMLDICCMWYVVCIDVGRWCIIYMVGFGLNLSLARS